VTPEEGDALFDLPLVGPLLQVFSEFFDAFGELGKDLSPEVREKAQKGLIAAVIVPQIAAQAAAISIRRRV
jgi:hypothetical protein